MVDSQDPTFPNIRSSSLNDQLASLWFPFKTETPWNSEDVAQLTIMRVTMFDQFCGSLLISYLAKAFVGDDWKFAISPIFVDLLEYTSWKMKFPESDKVASVIGRLSRRA